VSQGEEEAMRLYASGSYESAIALIGSNETSESDPALLKLKADCFQKTGEAELALEYYDRSRLLGYRGDDLFLNRGICKTALGYYDPARQDISQFLEKNPEDARAYYWLGTVEYFQMDNKASVRYLDEAIWYDSSYAAAYFLRASNYAEQGKNLIALEDFMQAYTLDSSLTRAKLHAAALMLDMERYRNAIELLSELKLEGADVAPEAMYYLGEARYRMHDQEGACLEWSEGASLGDIDAAENYRRLCVVRSGKPKFKRRTFGQF